MMRHKTHFLNFTQPKKSCNNFHIPRNPCLNLITGSWSIPSMSPSSSKSPPASLYKVGSQSVKCTLDCHCHCEDQYKQDDCCDGDDNCEEKFNDDDNHHSVRHPSGIDWWTRNKSRDPATSLPHVTLPGMILWWLWWRVQLEVWNDLLEISWYRVFFF